jgi:hypothetical protein
LFIVSLSVLLSVLLSVSLSVFVFSCRVSFTVHFVESGCQPYRRSSSFVPSFAGGPFCGDTSGSRCDAAPGVASVVVSRRAPSASGSSADIVFEILREIAVNIYRVLRVDSPTHYRFDIRIFRSVKSNVNKPAPCSTICHLACKCRIAGSCHQDARSVQ